MVLTTPKLIIAFNLACAVVAGWLLWLSLGWPLVGDATIFHFIAAQIKMGAVPYRDIADMNMPLTYAIHAAVITIGGMSDATWRVFDLTAVAIMSGLILALVWPAGRAPAVLAALTVVTMHLLLGRYQTGQRDFLMMIPALGAALAAARIPENTERRNLYLCVVGACAVAAALIKPTGAIFVLLPALTTRPRLRDIIWVGAGAALVGVPACIALAALGGLGPFVTMLHELLPIYAAMGDNWFLDVLGALRYAAPVAGLALAAAFGLTAARSPRVRAMIGLTIFGLISLLVQRKGWTYHVYPFGVGMACWGAWALSCLPKWRALACLAMSVGFIGYLAPEAAFQAEYDAVPAASKIMQASLEKLPRGSRVQMLDADSGAFLAMARSGMRQATPHIQWFSLLLGTEQTRFDFLDDLKANPPDAVLMTDDQWPRGPGFEATDEWSEFSSFLALNYRPLEVGREDHVQWRLYLKRPLQ
jgi:hypothetical protein